MIPVRAVSRIDRVGIAIFGMFAVWVGLTALLAGRSPSGALSTLLLCGAAFGLGVAGTRLVAPWLVPVVIVLLGYAVFIHSPAGTLSNLSARGFLGYANAKAAFFVQAAFAAALVMATVSTMRSPLVILLCLPAIALFVAVPIHARSLGGALSSLLLVPGILVALIGRGRHAAIVLAAVVAAAAIATSTILAREFATQLESETVSRIATRVDTGRAEVWADAYTILGNHPWFGVGPGGFAWQSPTAAREPDLRWAHNEFLQQGAESGLLGLALLLALLGWLYWKLWDAGKVAAAVAALALSALVVHACAEYLFHFLLLPTTAAALAGSTATAVPRTKRRLSQF